MIFPYGGSNLSVVSTGRLLPLTPRGGGEYGNCHIHEPPQRGRRDNTMTTNPDDHPVTEATPTMGQWPVAVFDPPLPMPPAPQPRRNLPQGALAKLRLTQLRSKIRTARAARRLTSQQADELAGRVTALVAELDRAEERYRAAQRLDDREVIFNEITALENRVVSYANDVSAWLEELAETVADHTVKLGGHDQQLAGVRKDHQKLTRRVARIEESSGIKTPLWKYLVSIAVGLIAGWMVWQYDFQNLIEFRTGGVADFHTVMDEPWFAIGAGIAASIIVLGLLLGFGGARSTKRIERSEERVVETTPAPNVERRPALSTPREPDRSGDTAVLPREPVASRQSGDS